MNKVTGRSVSVLGLGACFLGASLLAVACSDDPGTAAPDTSAGDAATGLDSQPAISLPEVDSSATPDAGEEVITEGGGLPAEDPDAGVDDDAGIDAGAACGVVNTGAYTATTCSNRLSTMTGGALTTTTYALKALTVLRSATFCSTTFTPYDHRAGLKVTASSTSAAKFELLDLYRKSGAIAKPTSYRFDAEVVASGNTLNLTQGACASRPAPTTASYSVGTDGGKKVLSLRMPYGSGDAIYRFVEL